MNARIGLVLCFALFLAACQGADEAGGGEQRPLVRDDSITFPAGSAAAQRLAVEKVKPPSERELAIPGRLVWDEERTVRIFPPFAGRVSKLVARVGDHVQAGSVLAEIASPDFAQAQSEARRADADLMLATKGLERQRELNANGVASGKDLQQAETDLMRARAEHDRAAGRLRTYGQPAAGMDGMFLLKSPVAGTVVERTINPGQELRPDQSGPPLFVVSDPTHLWVSLDSAESTLRDLKPGMLLLVTSGQFADETFAGQLTQVADFVDPTSRTVKVRGEVGNADRRLKAEMFVTARVKVPPGESPTVNAHAVYLEGVRSFAFVRAPNGSYVRKPVRAGPEEAGRVPVLAGLREGDEVVVSGNLYLAQLLASARPGTGEGAAKP